VLNFVILRHVTRRYGTHWLAMIVVSFGVAAAAVGIMQVVIGTPFPMYGAWYESYFRRPPPDFTLASTRAIGTMSNPILYCVLMALVIPYAFDVKNRVVRAVALFAVMFAAGLTGSRTGVFIVAAFAAGAFVVYRRRAVRALPSVAVGVALLFACLALVRSDNESSRLGLLGRRLSFVADRAGAAEISERAQSSGGASRTASPTPPGGVAAAPPSAVPRNVVSRADVSAALGVNLRQQAVVEVVQEMAHEWGPMTWIVGRGSFTAPLVGTRIRSWYNTVDNVFLSVVYERGLSGLALFIGAFLAVLIATRRAARETLHWFAPLALAVAGLSFCWDAYSMFNILAVGSMVITLARCEDAGSAARERLAGRTTPPLIARRPGQE
jgi:hypothetical protein